MSFHRVVGDAAFVADELMPGSDERLIPGRVGGHEVVPCRQVPDEVAGVETRKLLFADREGDDGDVVGRNPGSGKFLVEAYVRIVVDRRDDAHPLSVSTQRDDVGNDL